MKLSSILVALDSSGSFAVLKAAVELAYRTEAELNAIFVEDAEWFEASRLSFTQQVSGYTGALIPFTERHLIEQSRALGTMLQNTINELGNLMQIRYSYQSVRGVINSELMKAAMGRDLVMIGRKSRSPGRSDLGSTARFLAENSPAPLLVWNNGSEWPRQFIGICTTPAQSQPVVSWTVGLGDTLKREVRLFWPDQIELFGLRISRFTEDAERSQEDRLGKVKEISELHPDLSPDLLRQYRQTLFIIRRNALRQKPGEILHHLPNSVLLL